MSALRFLWWPFAFLSWIHSHNQLWSAWTDSETSVSIFQYPFPWPDGIFSRRELNPKSPIHLHLALTNEPSQVLIQFTTINEGIPVAVYGWKGDGDTEKAFGTSTTFSSNDLCHQASTSITPAHYHSVLLSNLQPDKRYHYQVGITVGQGIIWSESVMFFQSPPQLDESSYSFVVLANQGTLDGKDSVQAITKLVESSSHSVHAIHHLGGLSYARGNITTWDEWFRMIQVYASQVPLMIVVGSTEYDYLNGTGDPSGVNTSYTPTWGNFGNDDSGGECGVIVSKRFQMPRGGNGVFWYRQESPLLTTIVLSSEHDLRPSSPQYQWLEKELQEVHKNDQWIIVEIHRPLYMNQALWSENNVGLGLRRSMEALLRNKVHLVLSGHYPAYFRSCAGLYLSRCHNGGPTHITLGSAARASPIWNNTKDDAEWYPASWATKTIDNTRGLGRVTIHNRSTLEFQWIGLDQEDSENGNVLDQVWITK